MKKFKGSKMSLPKCLNSSKLEKVKFISIPKKTQSRARYKSLDFLSETVHKVSVLFGRIFIISMRCPNTAETNSFQYTMLSVMGAMEKP